jgi:hypothetical protein
MIDRHYGHLARDGREHAIRLLDGYAAAVISGVHQVDTPWTPQQENVAPPKRRFFRPSVCTERRRVCRRDNVVFQV